MDDAGGTGPWAGTRAFVRSLATHAGGRGIAAVALVAVGAVLEGFGILLLVPILSLIVADTDMVPLAATFGALGIDGPRDRLAVLLAGFVALMLVRGAVLHLRDIRLAELQTGFVDAMRGRVVTALASAPWSRVVALRHARVTHLLGGDVARIATSAHLLMQGGVAAVLLAVQAVLAMLLAPLLAGAVVVAIALGLGVTLVRARHARDSGSGLVHASLTLMQGTTGFLGGLKAAIAENAQGRFVAEFAQTQAEMRGHQVAFQRHQSRLRVGFATASALAGAAVVWIGVASGVAGGVLATLILLFARMSGPVVILQGALQNFLFGLPSFEAVRALERDLGGRGARASTRPTPPPPGGIELRGVMLRHPGGGGVEALSLAIAVGELIGIEGPSGAGKTTLVDLLAGLVRPDAGELRVGGVALDAATQEGWRACVAYVAQDGFLFHDSVRGNLTWGTDADDAAIAQALALTGGDAVVAGLPQGLDTIVGERGARLSGGERQRLAIARALLRRPRLLLLDEATAAIDVAGEAALLGGLIALDPRPTIVVVAHRRETLAHCDRVIRLAAGRMG